MGTLNEKRIDAELEKCSEKEDGYWKNISAIKEAVKVLLQGLGEDANREGLEKTPLRVAKSFIKATIGYQQMVNDIIQGGLFSEAGLDSSDGQGGGAGGLIVVRDLNLFSLCESCLLPFQVQCHVGYVPSEERIVGFSKLCKVSDVFAKRLQNPQHLADEICSSLHNGINPHGVAIVLQCWHLQSPNVDVESTNPCFHPSKVEMQGWEKLFVKSASGVFENENGDFWADFVAFLKFQGIDVKAAKNRPSIIPCWCPSESIDSISNEQTSQKNPSRYEVLCEKEPDLLAMANAVSVILHSLGEDPSRKELVDTPLRFVHWLMHFKKCNSGMDLNLNGFGSGKNFSTDKNGDGSSPDQYEIHSELNLPVWSLCEHHLLPFHGVVHIGFFSSNGNDPIKRRSMLQSIVHFHGCKLQTQERLSTQIAETVSSVLGGDVIVIVEANQLCIISRGIKQPGSSTVTTAALGRFSTDSTAKATFLESISNTTA